MKTKLLFLFCFSSFLITTAISQNAFNRSTFFRKNILYKTIYSSLDSLNDTLRSVVFKDRTVFVSSPRVIVVMEEFFVGIPMSFMVALPCGFIGGLIATKIIGEEGAWAGFGAVVIGLSTGLVIGYPYGVYIAAKSEKRDVSYWGVLASEIVGLGIGIGINAATDHKGIGRWTPLVLPLSFPIIYVELFN